MGIDRTSRVTPDLDGPAQTASPLIISHGAFVGLSLMLSDGAATVTVAVDSSKTGDFANVVTMEGTGKHRWPNADGMNRLYNAAYVKITWSTGTIRVFQKG